MGINSLTVRRTFIVVRSRDGMDSTEIPVYGQQENSAYNRHFESTCFHPRLLFNREGDCLGAKL